MFLGTDHLPLPQPNINPYFSLWAKCWPRGGVGGQFPKIPETYIDPKIEIVRSFALIRLNIMPFSL